MGGGAGAGLLIAWAFWPRSYPPNLRAAAGETLFNAYLKIGVDGRVIVAVPQAEIGQGTYTSLPQILADELGADWRTVAVEPAPLSPIYANKLLADESVDTGYATASALMMTGGSTSVRAFEGPLREAGAAARALLMKAAARRWDSDWQTLDTVGGFVVNGPERLSFASLAEEAAELDVPDPLPVRGGPNNRLTGQSLPRIDLPAKVDGSAQFAADVRLPGMVYASVRQGPRGASRLVKVDRAAADAVPGVLAVLERPGWAAAVATNWWAANRGVEALKPVFETRGEVPDSGSIEAALGRAMESEATSVLEQGDPAAGLEGGQAFRAHYSVGLAPNAPMETLTATARLTGDRLEVWAPTQAPGLARAAAARAAGLPEAQVTLYPTLVGSGYGRKLEMAAVEQAAIIAIKLERPVQLVWSRIEESLHDTFRPPARATISASISPRGTILAWQSRIAAPPTPAQVMERIGATSGEEEAAVAGAAPPYAIPAVGVDYAPADIGIDTGLWRSGAHSFTAFFNECFVDELSRKAGIEPLSFRMQMLGQNPRLARVLSTAAALAGWDGGQPGSSMGIACHSAYGSHVATLVEVEVSEEQRVKVLRAVAAVDCGRVVNPDIVRQLIEGGIVYGITGAAGNPIRLERGLPDRRYLRELAFPRLADTPEVTVEIVPSEEEPGGVTELGVPSVAPAIANALFALTGRRLRSLPLVLGSGA
ncbi:MAG TPA: molybdopterin cofactor-binding domain-containing protein [Allosphingosinicella sp.]|nr:molybdopterin cofactor-binding domain-containing protein [Allosphingosinicella sp.]